MFSKVVALLPTAGLRLPSAVLVGVEVAEVAPGEGLSAPVRGALRRVLQAVRHEIGAASPAAEEVRA
jgi:hypothetical protein